MKTRNISPKFWKGFCVTVKVKLKNSKEKFEVKVLCLPIQKKSNEFAEKNFDYSWIIVGAPQLKIKKMILIF